MGKRLLILGTQVEFTEMVKKAVERGWYTVVCDGYEDGPARLWADRAYTVDVREIDRIAEIAREEKIDRILTSFSDIMFECMVRIADKAGIPCYMGPDMLPAFRNKAVARKLCEEAGIRVPAYYLLTKENLTKIPSDFPFPAVLKPVDSYGSRGLRVVHDPAEVKLYFAQSAACSIGDDTALLEGMSRGQELNCMGLVMDGKVKLISIADRMTASWESSRIPVNYAIRYPSAFFDDAREAVTDTMQRFADKTGMTDGPMAMQCFYDGEGVEVCEIAGRFFGFEHEMVLITTGMDMEDLLLDMAFDPDAVKRTMEHHDPKGFGHASCVYLHSIADGVLKDQESLYQLCEHPAARAHLLFYKEGEHVGVLGPRQYFARYYMYGDTHDEMLKAERDVFERARAYDTQDRQLLYLPPLYRESSEKIKKSSSLHAEHAT